MKRQIIAVLCACVPTLGGAQELPKFASPLIVEVRSADSTRVLRVDLSLDGHFLSRIGVARPDTGSISMAGSLGVATTPSILELSEAPGSVELSSAPSGPELRVIINAADETRRRVIAGGHRVHIARDAFGRIRITAARMESGG